MEYHKREHRICIKFNQDNNASPNGSWECIDQNYLNEGPTKASQARFPNFTSIKKSWRDKCMEEFNFFHDSLKLNFKILSLKCDSYNIVFIQFVLGGWDRVESWTYEENTHIGVRGDYLNRLTFESKVYFESIQRASTLSFKINFKTMSNTKCTQGVNLSLKPNYCMR